LPIHALTRCAAIALSLVALGLGGCGRRGNLEPAPGAQAPAAPEQNAGSMAPGLSGSKGPKSSGISAPKEPFILDPLL
jgi:predicted small lipoprotein YifL